MVDPQRDTAFDREIGEALRAASRDAAERARALPVSAVETRDPLGRHSVVKIAAVAASVILVIIALGIVAAPGSPPHRQSASGSMRGGMPSYEYDGHVLLVQADPFHLEAISPVSGKVLKVIRISLPRDRAWQACPTTDPLAASVGSPDAYVVCVAPRVTELMAVSLRTGVARPVRQISLQNSVGVELAMSTDGRYLAVANEHAGHWSLLVTNLRSARVVVLNAALDRLRPRAIPGQLAWSPKNDVLAFEPIQQAHGDSTRKELQTRGYVALFDASLPVSRVNPRLANLPSASRFQLASSWSIAWSPFGNSLLASNLTCYGCSRPDQVAAFWLKGAFGVASVPLDGRRPSPAEARESGISLIGRLAVDPTSGVIVAAGGMTRRALWFLPSTSGPNAVAVTQAQPSMLKAGVFESVAWIARSALRGRNATQTSG